MLDWTRALKTLEAVRELSYYGYILAHGGIYRVIRSMTEYLVEQGWVRRAVWGGRLVYGPGDNL